MYEVDGRWLVRRADDSICLEGHDFTSRSDNLAVTFDSEPDRLLRVTTDAEIVDS